MGKIFRYDKPALSLVIFLTLLFLVPVHGYASYKEYDLLQKGYESYLSYQPEKAAEEFRTFLQEFPNSSARDAALFWLGKSLIQAKSADEAGPVFTELKRQFPHSPFVAFIVTHSESPESERPTSIRETETVLQSEASKDTSEIRHPEPAGKTDDAITEPSLRADTIATSELPAEKKAEAVIQPSETVAGRSAGDKGAVSAQEDLPMKPADDMIAKIEEPEATKSEAIKMELPERENKEPALQKSEVIESAAELPSVALPMMVPPDTTPEPENIKAPETVVVTTIVGEQVAGSLQSELLSGQTPDSRIEIKEPEIKEPEIKEPEIKEPEIKEPEVKEPEVKEPEVKEPAQLQEVQATGEEAGKQTVEGTKELPSETKEEARSDQIVLNKVGIQGALWSTGDRNQDFIDEQILFNEAVKLNLSVDDDELNELRAQYTLGIEEVDYLKRFLLICKLIDKKAKELPGEKIVEVMSVGYKDTAQRERPELAAELQALANKGDTFEDISRSYPDVVQFRTITVTELPEWVQERIQGLQNYEIGVIWSEEGYMILKPIIRIYSYDPFEELSSQEREKLTGNIRSWIAELKGANPGDPVSK